MEISTLETALSKFIEENLVAEGIKIVADSDLGALGLDSFSLIEIVLFLERKFGIELPDELLISENVGSVGAIAKCSYNFVNQK
jgi:acyl carrier protein